MSTVEKDDYLSIWETMMRSRFDFTTFTSEAEMDDVLGGEPYAESIGSKVAAAVTFQSFPEFSLTAPGNVEFAIRMNFTGTGARPVSNSVFAPPSQPIACYTQEGCGARYIVPTNIQSLNTVSKSVQQGVGACAGAQQPRGQCAQLSYANSGFLTLQQVVETFAADPVRPYVPLTELTARPVSASLFPEAAYRTDDFAGAIGALLPLFIILSYIVPVSQLIRALVLEKERKIKEGMKMMGLTNSAFYLSWFATTFVQFLLIAVLVTAVARNGTNNSVFIYSEGIMVFIFFLVFNLSVITLCWLISVFFSKSKTAATVGVLLFFATYFPSVAVENPDIGYGAKIMASLLSPTAFTLGMGVFADQEGGQVGVKLENINTVTASNFSVGAAITMMLVDFFLYAFLGWYLDKVLPSGTSTV